MSYVAVTERVLNEIRESLQEAWRAEKKVVMEQLYPVGVESLPGEAWFIALVEQAIWGEHLPLKDSMPPKWVHRAHQLHVHIGASDIKMKISIPVNSDQFLLPPDQPTYSAEFEISADNFADEDLKLKLLAYMRKMDAIDTKYTNIQNQLVTFLKRCKSLNEAAQSYPDIRLFLLPRTVARLDKKPVREKKSDPKLEGMDTSLITATGVASTMRKKDGDPS